MKQSKITSIILRYTIIILLAFPNLFLFYAIFTPLTIYPVYFLLKLFYDASLQANMINIIGYDIIELIPACIAGSAYYLLFILNVSVPNIKIKKRINMIALSFFALLIINILRIFLLSLMHFSGSSFFDITHQLFWYLLSTIFVVGIWFAEVKYFKIKDIPIYSDLKFIYKKSIFSDKKINKTKSSK